MDSGSLESGQAKRLSAEVFRLLNYLLRLRNRMQAIGFPPDDKLYKLVCEAYNALYGLSVEVHYLSCKSGVGKPPKE